MFDEEEYEWVLADIVHDEFMIRGGLKIVHREIIDLKETELMLFEIDNLKDYVWKGDYLIPIEILEGDWYGKTELLCDYIGKC